MNRMLSFLTGAALGAVFGAGIAILLAPMSGEDLQNQIRTRVTEIQDDVQQAASEKRAELEAQLQHLRAQSS